MAKRRTFQNVTQLELADIHGVDVRTVRRWDEDGHPRNEDGSYTPAESIRWVIGRESGSSLDYTAERARLAKAQADKTEIENAVRAGELSVTARVVEWYGAMVANAKNRLLQVPDAIGQQFDPETARRVVALARERIHEALAELAGPGITVARADTGDVGAAADADGEPVGGPVPETVQRGKRGARNLAN
jgi:terminase small subunit / prophage DNA-packing protein